MQDVECYPTVARLRDVCFALLCLIGGCTGVVPAPQSAPSGNARPSSWLPPSESRSPAASEPIASPPFVVIPVQAPKGKQ